MKLVWLLLVALITPIRVEASQQDLLPELVRRIKPSAVAIETFDARGEKLSRGSGFFIDFDRIVTNRHVIEGAHRAEVHSSNGTVIPVKGVLAVDAEGDIALLKIDAPTPQVKPLPLDKTSPQEGESVVVIGNPLGLEGSVTNGIVSAVRDIPTFGRIIQITAAISDRIPVKGVLAVDAEGDIALLKIDAPTPQVKPLPLDKTSPQEGESVVVIGNPLGLEGSVTNGIVSAVRDIPTFGRIIQITAAI